jgi:hypothetical protein
MWNYYGVWKVLETLLGDLKEKGVEPPEDFLSKLKAVHGIINIFMQDTTYDESQIKLEEDLNEIEGQLIYLAEREVSNDYADAWIAKIKTARDSEPEVPHAKPFSVGVPRADYWLRLTVGDIIDKDDLQKMATEQGLSVKEEDPETVIVHGDEAKVKALVKEMTAKQREKKDRA